jgi:EAL domain-containing protein (putative c-di-GMP-specific phosphodiesterase class I)
MVMAGEPLAGLLRRAKRDLILEITEHDQVDDYVALRQAIAALGEGVRFAIDDAGAGFASLRHILELSPTHVKLDRGLVSRIHTDPARQALVAGLVHFAERVDLRLIAEGVETMPERDTLLRLGVRIGQGFLFGQPKPADRQTHARRTQIQAG